MDKFLVIEGQVISGHRLADLGVNVPYQEEVVLNFERANWSRDLNHALQQGLVIKKRVIRGSEMQSRRPSSPPPPKSPASLSPVPKKQDASKPKPSLKVPETNDQTLRDQREENKKLREMNESLVQTMNQLFEQQKKLFSQLESFVNRPVRIEGLENSSVQSVSFSGGVTKKADTDKDVDHVPTFIPSKIRSGKAKTSQGAEIESQRKKSNNFSEAASALKEMKAHSQQDSDD